MDHAQLPSLEGTSSNPNDLVSWLEAQPHASLVSSAQAIFTQLLANATRPRNASGSSCVKLCGFVQQSTRSKEPALRSWAFSEDTAMKLFNFYIEWNEKDQHRSMKLVLDLLSLSIKQNPNAGVGDFVKNSILESLVSIISRQSTRPLVKSSTSSLHHLLSKSIISLGDIDQTYRKVRPDVRHLSAAELWENLVVETFSWMSLHHVAPVAGKLLVSLFRSLRDVYPAESGEKGFIFNSNTLQVWLLTAVKHDPEILEEVKNYIFAPLFKADRKLSLEVLADFNRQGSTSKKTEDNLDTVALLHLAALEVGKKAALVQEPSLTGKTQASDIIVLEENILEPYLRHPSQNVRSLAMSLLIASASTTRPYSKAALALLQRYLGACHTDSDAKFRNDILGHSKTMVIRLKGAISLLQKEIGEKGKVAPEHKPAPNGKANKVHKRIGKVAADIATDDVAWLKATVKLHEDFFHWYLHFLRNELVPTASYQRHIASLKSLTAVLKHAKDVVGSYDCLDLGTAAHIYRNYAWIRSILDLIMDPFDDVRESAVSLLMLFPPEIAAEKMKLGGDVPSVSLLEILRDFCSRAVFLASKTARADHADGAARSYGLLCSWLGTQELRHDLLLSILRNLEANLAKAESDLGHAALEHPIHGDFAALRYVWEVLAKSHYNEEETTSLAEAQTSIISSCKRIWKAVSYVLCDDSPEGHLPQEMEEVEGLDTKDLLSYSFRAIYESSNLMRTVVSTLRLSQDKGTLVPSRQVFEDVGNLTFEQLSSLRHRGAFSMVSLTFTTCCQLEKVSRAAIQNISTDGTLLETWYKGALSCIYEQASTTRRSAGIPALMCGILAANADKPSLGQVIKQLQEIASTPARISETDGSNLPQVHALNCIKDTFKSSLLSKRAEVYLPECLQLATTSLKSEVWAIRNCGLLLLRSLIDCLFGTNENKSSMDAGWDGKTLRVSYVKYPTLSEDLISLLQSGRDAMEAGVQNSAAESVFPALDIIRRAGPPDAHRDELYGLIAEYLGSHLWHVREIAARTLCSFLLHKAWVPLVNQLLYDAVGSTNRLHGTLLTIKSCLERVSEVTPDSLEDNIRDLAAVLERHQKKTGFAAPELHASYAEIVSLAWSLAPSSTGYFGLEEQDVSFTTGKPAALLDTRLAIQTVQLEAQASNTTRLKDAIIVALAKDTNTACDMLRAIPQIWQGKQVVELCKLYLSVCSSTRVPEPRAIALNNLTDLLDDLLDAGRLDDLPKEGDFVNLSKALSIGDINLDFSHAILRISGPVMAARALRGDGQLDRQLREWGRAMSDAGKDDNTFDMRFAAASAIKSFASALGKHCAQASHLPFLLGLYDTLNDDDEEIRDVGSLASAAVLGQALVPVDAAQHLLSWLGLHFGHLEEFRSHVTERMAGCSTVTTHLDGHEQHWTSPEEQFEQTLQFNHSLFVIEEQNLYIDEVREAGRWTALFSTLPYADGEASLASLRAWTQQGMDKLVALAAAVADDGPLGWTSKPATFALCSTVVQCAAALARSGADQDQDNMERRLGALRAAGQTSRLHGTLLSMAGIHSA